MDSATTRVLAVVASGLVGLAMGSFLNVVIYRLPRSESIANPPSRCPRCGTTLGPLENIPVLSWLALRGRCRHCGAPISLRYPLVELGTAFAFVAVALASSTTAPLAPLDAVLAATIAIGAIDLDGERVPPVLGWIVLVCSATLVAVSLAEHHPGWLDDAGVAAGAGVVAWILMRQGGGSEDLVSLSGLAALVGWGWAAGWTGEVGCLFFSAALIGLALLAVATSRRALLATISAWVAVVAVVLGSVAGR